MLSFTLSERTLCFSCLIFIFFPSFWAGCVTSIMSRGHTHLVWCSHTCLYLQTRPCCSNTLVTLWVFWGQGVAHTCDCYVCTSSYEMLKTTFDYDVQYHKWLCCLAPWIMLYAVWAVPNFQISVSAYKAGALSWALPDSPAINSPFFWVRKPRIWCHHLSSLLNCCLETSPMSVSCTWEYMSLSL